MGIIDSTFQLLRAAKVSWNDMVFHVLDGVSRVADTPKYCRSFEGVSEC